MVGIRRSHSGMFYRCFERLYQENVEAGLPPDLARELAADAAWLEYERYCDDKYEESKERGL